MHIVLVEPEIPQNTGNIARLCAATGCKLHLVRPLGFSVDDKYLKRAGLDYWHLVDIFYHDSFADLQAQFPGKSFYLNTTKAGKRHTEICYGAGDFLVFGKETKGLSPDILRQYPENQVRIPMIAEARSLNLSNAVAVVVYEALRQQGFAELK
ncbi:MAG: tRNA (uridine(34)/cytosine(34)/5-carboxymethylaminomethyluridine(34)-2'-O)-methyltransferase TrmL [Bacillota bacterium]|nr:tRNA (uridine(34)/cytosine(34)/5-carboxymethylaminomethyluridine(34)-2'-O)-methyltransferase TrmL [Bacillota bacterium]